MPDWLWLLIIPLVAIILFVLYARFGPRHMSSLRGGLSRHSRDWTMPAEAEEPRTETSLAPSPPQRFDENVQFSVYRPRTVVPGQWYPLLAFAHLSEKRPDSPAAEPDPVQEVQRQASRLLGEQARDYQPVVQDATAAVPQQGELTLVPDVSGVEFNPPRRSFHWQEPIHREEFRLRAAAELDGRTARGRLSVFLGGILLADVPLAIRVDRAHQPAAAEKELEINHARPYRRIFASYSHKDLTVVEQFERFARSLGDEYLRDWKHLRAGEVWDERLLRLIEEADVFQLFWSRNAMESAYVRKEWEHALSLGRPNFVRPTYWEEPLPVAPERGLPPDELRRLHFQRIFGDDPATPASPLPRTNAMPAMTPPALPPAALSVPSMAPSAHPPPRRGRPAPGKIPRTQPSMHPGPEWRKVSPWETQPPAKSRTSCSLVFGLLLLAAALGLLAWLVWQATR